MSHFKKKKDKWEIFDEKENLLRKKYKKFNEVSEQFYHYRNQNPCNTTFDSLVHAFVDVFKGKRKKLRKNLAEEAWVLYVKKKEMPDSKIVQKSTFYEYLLNRT